jgi:hypothetical protein
MGNSRSPSRLLGGAAVTQKRSTAMPHFHPDIREGGLALPPIEVPA